MAAELAAKIYEAGFDSHDQEQIFAGFNEMTEARYEELLKIVSDRLQNPLARLRNGEGLLMKDINKAVEMAANDPKT